MKIQIEVDSDWFEALKIDLVDMAKIYPDERDMLLNLLKIFLKAEIVELKE